MFQSPTSGVALCLTISRCCSYCITCVRLYRWLVCLFMSVCMQMEKKNPSSGCCGWHAEKGAEACSINAHKFPAERQNALMGRLNRTAHSLVWV